MLGDNRALFESCPQRAVLDHHESNPHFGQINHVEPNRAACGEIALLLIEAMGAPLSKDMAACLFAAVSSDTGNFNYSNTTAETFEAAAACVRARGNLFKTARRQCRRLEATKRFPRSVEGAEGGTAGCLKLQSTVCILPCARTRSTDVYFTAMPRLALERSMESIIIANTNRPNTTSCQ